MGTRLQNLKLGLKNNRALDVHEKRTIEAWINQAYEIGMLDAGDLLGSKLGEVIKQFDSEKGNKTQ